MTPEPTPLIKSLADALNGIKERSKEYGMSLTDQEVIDNKVHVEFMRRPHLWKTGDILPLKRRRDGELPGVVWALAILTIEDWDFVVHENMSMMGISFGGEVTIHRYATPEDVVIAGWEVD